VEEEHAGGGSPEEVLINALLVSRTGYCESDFLSSVSFESDGRS
jgi:hypothetical protein